MGNPANEWLDWPLIPRWAKVLGLAALLAFVAYLAAYCYAWRLHGLPMRIGSIYLKSLHRSWRAAGSPANPVLTNYVISTSDRYYIWTNHYTFAGVGFESQFALETSLFQERGFLVISRDGRLAWIDKRTGPELVEP